MIFLIYWAFPKEKICNSLVRNMEIKLSLEAREDQLDKKNDGTE